VAREHEELKERPRKVTFRRNKEQADSLVELAKLIKMFGKGSGGYTQQQNRTQKCVAKMQYSSSIAAHKKQLTDYLTREGTGKNGEEAELFGTDINEYKDNMVGKNFRIFLSPQSDKVDLKAMTKDFVKRLELQTGYKLLWQGACHYNTANPHSHLLINGHDKDGKEINFSKDVVKTFMRETARDICTKQVGLRTDKDIALEKERELSSSRFTKLDEKILSICSENNKIFPGGFFEESKKIKKRLETLKELKLCKYENHGYTMRKNWAQDLKANSRYNTFLKARDELKYSKPAQLKVYEGRDGDKLTGKVTKIYRTDGDASDNHAVVLESLDGKAFFIPLLKEPEVKDKDKRLKLKEGELITLSTYENQKGRLTPLIFKKDLRSAQKEIKNNELDSKLAVEMLAIKPASRVFEIGLGRN